MNTETITDIKTKDTFLTTENVILFVAFGDESNAILIVSLSDGEFVYCNEEDSFEGNKKDVIGFLNHLGCRKIKLNINNKYMEVNNMNIVIKNNRCSVVENTNQDIYNGSFTNESGDITYVYIISFEPGTQARGHKVADFKLFQRISDGQLIFHDNYHGTYDDILLELLKGF